MAESMTVTHTGATSDGDVRRLQLAWVSAADGSVTQATPIPINGEIVRVCFIPSATAAPTTLYDATITDSDGIDILAGQGANLSATVSSNVCPGVPLKDGTTTGVREMVVNSVLTLNITNAGDSKGGTVVLYVR